MVVKEVWKYLAGGGGDKVRRSSRSPDHTTKLAAEYLEERVRETTRRMINF